MNETWVIVGKTDEDDEEHFINCSSAGDSIIKTYIRMLGFRFNPKFRRRYRKIYMRRLYLS